MEAILTNIKKIQTEDRKVIEEVSYNFLNVVQKTKIKLIKLFHKSKNNKYFSLIIILSIILQLIISQKKKK